MIDCCVLKLLHIFPVFVPRCTLTLKSLSYPFLDVSYEPSISAGERRQTHALDRAATGTGGGTEQLFRGTPIFVSPRRGRLPPVCAASLLPLISAPRCPCYESSGVDGFSIKHFVLSRCSTTTHNNKRLKLRCLASQ